MFAIVAEDDCFLRTLVEDFLSEMGHAVQGVPDGGRLVELALIRKPDLIITDLNMPGISGGTAIAMLDIHPALTGIPLIVVTGATPEELAECNLPAGIAVLRKPFNFGQLALEIERVLLRGPSAAT